MKWIMLVFQYLPVVLHGVVAVESVMGAGNGKAKKQLILDAITAGAKVGETAPTEHVAVISTLIDSVVTSLNASGILKGKATPMPTVPAISAEPLAHGLVPATV